MERFFGSGHRSGIYSRVCSLDRSLERRGLFVQHLGLLQKTDARVGMPDLLHARGERNCQEPRQGNQCDQRKPRLPYC